MTPFAGSDTWFKDMFNPKSAGYLDPKVNATLYKHYMQKLDFMVENFRMSKSLREMKYHSDKIKEFQSQSKTGMEYLTKREKDKYNKPKFPVLQKKIQIE